MFAAVKFILALGIACGTLIATIAEAAHPLLVACFWVAFACGAIAAEGVRAHRKRTVRSLVRGVGVPDPQRRASRGTA
jgi:hypothetical protein